MIAIPGSLEQFRTAQSHRYVLCWELARTDGVAFRFTTHNRALVLADGYTYTPAGSFMASAVRREADGAPHDRELTGVLSSDLITEADLFAGKYRDCAVTEILVDWMYAWAGDLEATTYWITEFAFDGKVWTPTIEGLTAWANRISGDVYSRDCRWDFGDDDCGLSKSTFRTPGTVATVVDDTLEFTTGNILAAGYYDHGEVEWLTGNNAGATSTIKEFTQPNGKVLLQEQLPYAIEVGDTLALIAGCDGLGTTCNSKFSNILRFGGFPFIPGTDRAFRYE